MAIRINLRHGVKPKRLELASELSEKEFGRLQRRIKKSVARDEWVDHWNPPQKRVAELADKIQKNNPKMPHWEANDRAIDTLRSRERHRRRAISTGVLRSRMRKQKR